MFELEFDNKKVLSFVGLTLVLVSLFIVRFASIPLGLICAGIGAVAMALGVEQEESEESDECDELEETEGDDTND